MINNSDRYMDGSGDYFPPAVEQKPLPEEPNLSRSFIEYTQPLISYLQSCVCFDGPSSVTTSVFFSILVIIGITLNVIGDPFNPSTGTKAVVIDQRVVEAQNALGEEWSAHQAVRAQVEQERKAWEEELKEMEKRRKVSQIRDKERLKMERERKKWEKETASRAKMKRKFEAEMESSEKKWKEEKIKNKKWRDAL